MAAFFAAGEKGSEDMAGPVYLNVDISQLQGTIEQMRAIHTQKKFELLMMRAFRRTGQRVKTILKAEIPKDYEARPRWIGQTVGRPRTQFGGFGGMAVSCSVPIDGERGVLGRRFHAAGPPGRRAKGKRYKITSQIVKGQKSVLPETMDNYGGQPPFIARSGKSGFSGAGVVFTRKGESRLPIVRVVGRGVPQMPIARSEDKVQDEIMETLKGRIEHEHKWMIGAIKKR